MAPLMASSNQQDLDQMRRQVEAMALQRRCQWR